MTLGARRSRVLGAIWILAGLGLVAAAVLLWMDSGRLSWWEGPGGLLAIFVGLHQWSQRVTIDRHGITQHSLTSTERTLWAGIAAVDVRATWVRAAMTIHRRGGGDAPVRSTSGLTARQRDHLFEVMHELSREHGFELRRNGTAVDTAASVPPDMLTLGTAGDVAPDDEADGMLVLGAGDDMEVDGAGGEGGAPPADALASGEPAESTLEVTVEVTVEDPAPDAPLVAAAADDDTPHAAEPESTPASGAVASVAAESVAAGVTAAGSPAAAEAADAADAGAAEVESAAVESANAGAAEVESAAAGAANVEAAAVESANVESGEDRDGLVADDVDDGDDDADGLVPGGDDAAGFDPGDDTVAIPVVVDGAWSAGPVPSPATPGGDPAADPVDEQGVPDTQADDADDDDVIVDEHDTQPIPPVTFGAADMVASVTGESESAPGGDATAVMSAVDVGRTETPVQHAGDPPSDDAAVEPEDEDTPAVVAAADGTSDSLAVSRDNGASPTAPDGHAAPARGPGIFDDVVAARRRARTATATGQGGDPVPDDT